MAKVTLEIPGLLRDAVDGRAALEVTADDVAGVLKHVRDEHRVLASLILEAGELRPHVLLMLNDQCTRWLPEEKQRLSDGDRLVIWQAVSGG